MLVYSLLDVKAKEYGALVLAQNDEMIFRSLMDGVRSGDSLLARYPEDFHVMRLGVFDIETGQLVPENIPQLVASVREVLERGGMNGGR